MTIFLLLQIKLTMNSDTSVNKIYCQSSCYRILVTAGRDSYSINLDKLRNMNRENINYNQSFAQSFDVKCSHCSLLDIGPSSLHPDCRGWGRVSIGYSAMGVCGHVMLSMMTDWHLMEIAGQLFSIYSLIIIATWSSASKRVSGWLIQGVLSLNNIATWSSTSKRVSGWLIKWIHILVTCQQSGVSHSFLICGWGCHVTLRYTHLWLWYRSHRSGDQEILVTTVSGQIQDAGHYHTHCYDSQQTHDHDPAWCHVDIRSNIRFCAILRTLGCHAEGCSLFRCSVYSDMVLAMLRMSEYLQKLMVDNNDSRRQSRAPVKRPRFVIINLLQLCIVTLQLVLTHIT